MEPGLELHSPSGGVQVQTGIGPIAQGGLDEAFGFAVGAGRVDRVRRRRMPS